MHIPYFTRTGIMAVALLAGSAHAQTSNDTTNDQAPAATDKQAMRAANRQTSRAVRRALTATKGLISSNIAILAKGDVVTLVGTVPDQAQIQLAESATKGVPQVHTVSNQLVIEEEADH